MISLDPHFFKRIEVYLACVKELQLRLGKCGMNFMKTDGQLIELVLMNLRTPYDMLCSSFYNNWRSCKEDRKEYTFDFLYDLLIKDQQKFLEEGKLSSNHRAHLLKRNHKPNYKERGYASIFGGK